MAVQVPSGAATSDLNINSLVVHVRHPGIVYRFVGRIAGRPNSARVKPLQGNTHERQLPLDQLRVYEENGEE